MARRTRGTRTNTANGNTANRSRSGLRQFARERPLLVVGAGVAVGMTLGALLPWSRMEEELLGEQAERLRDSAREFASDSFDKVKSAAQRTYESASETLRGSDSNGGAAENSTTSQSGVSNAYDGSSSYR
jgi:ElaB/YqjD/DUF883 family membrane-anchored ribosome-binding protein